MVYIRGHKWQTTGWQNLVHKPNSVHKLKYNKSVLQEVKCGKTTGRKLSVLHRKMILRHTLYRTKNCFWKFEYQNFW